MNIDRLHILLTCNLGASTGVMVAKMNDIAKKSKSLEGIDIKIEAHPVYDLENLIDEYDVVLLGPQMKHRLKELSIICEAHHKPIEVINSMDYGLVDGGNILKRAILVYQQYYKK